MASKSQSSDLGVAAMLERWRKDRKNARLRKSDPLMERIRARHERIRRRIGLLDDSVDLIREDRNR